jgi:hypothetical protein
MYLSQGPGKVGLMPSEETNEIVDLDMLTKNCFDEAT